MECINKSNNPPSDRNTPSKKCTSFCGRNLILSTQTISNSEQMLHVYSGVVLKKLEISGKVTSQ
jgi:hypothetical protein